MNTCISYNKKIQKKVLICFQEKKKKQKQEKHKK